LKPPKGDEENWKKMTGELVKAAKLAVDGDAGAGAALMKAANCAGCHKAHKGS
jgi:mono/diheme cytochrome c family protein